jgi:hypothetical protein
MIYTLELQVAAQCGIPVCECHTRWGGTECQFRAEGLQVVGRMGGRGWLCWASRQVVRGRS